MGSVSSLCQCSSDSAYCYQECQLRSDCSLPLLAGQFPLNLRKRTLVRQGRDESRVEEDPFVKYQVAEPEIVGIAPSRMTVALAELAG